MPVIDGVDFESAWTRRAEGVVDSETGLIAFFISKDDLIASKRAAGRLRDLADIEEIQAAASTQNESDSDLTAGGKID